MKKHYFTSIVLTIALAFSVAAAESVDLSALSDQQLADLKARIVAEMESRHPVEETVFHFKDGGPWVLANSDGVKVYLTGRRKYSMPYYSLEAVFENESGHSLSVWAKDIKLDGWNMSGGLICGTIKSGEKKASEFAFNIEEALLSSFSDMKDLTFSVQTSDESYNTVHNFGSFCLKFNEVE